VFFFQQRDDAFWTFPAAWSALPRDCLCNDRCPTCDAEIEPDEHEAIQGAKSAKSAYAFSDRPALDPSPRFPTITRAAASGNCREEKGGAGCRLNASELGSSGERGLRPD
jgi:hypothetical protein